MLKKVVAIAVGVIVGLSGAAQPAIAAGTATTGCVGRSAITNSCSAGTVTIVVTQDGSATTVSLTGTPACMFNGAEVPCSLDGAWWSSSRNCYVRKTNPQPDPSDPLWQSHTDGAIYDCRLPSGVGGSRHTYQFWAATTPVSPGQVVQLAARAASSLRLQAIGVGMAPTPTSLDASSIGIVGLPNWMWVKDRSDVTWGPKSTSASDNGLSVTVTAKAQKVTWTMGDGSAPIVCTNAGTPYQPSYGKAQSPTCGYSGYQRQGTYAVKAVTHWVIGYTSNVGISGSLTMDLTSAVSVTIGELQTTG